MRLSVVIPVFNEADQVAETIRSLVAELRSAPAVDAEIVVADDGSTVDIEQAARRAAGDAPLHVERLERNSGRFMARLRGLRAAQHEYVLFVDAGVTVVPGSFDFIARQVADGRAVWNAHTEMETHGNPYAVFWDVVLGHFLSDYLDDPRDTSFGLDEFDRFPKGTTCFLAPRELLLGAFDAFQTRYEDTRYANDDGPIIRWLAARQPINIAPSFACVYSARRSLRSFVRHAFHRGVVFVDGHGHRGSRFFPAVIAFFPVSAALAVASVRRPLLVAPLAAVSVAGVAAAAAARQRRPTAEILSFATLAPVYAAAHGLGMWRGAALALAGRRSKGRG